MLKFLSIRNVVLIDKLDLDFPDGFVVFSGETGAGKSILLDSLGFVMGSRADVSLIRQGCDKMTVSAEFLLKHKNENLVDICKEYDLDFSEEIMIKRSLSADGKGKIFFNDQPITLKLLKEIGACLAEIHGQFDNQGLLNPATHLSVLDSFGGYSDELIKLKKIYCEYNTASEQRQNAEQKISQAKQDEDNLRHWLTEFEAIKPKKGELETLEEKRRQMMNSEKITENMDSAYKALNQNSGVRDALRQAMTAVARVNAVTNDKFADISGLLDTALINIEEAGEEINQVLSDFTWNNDSIDSVEERLFSLKSLARKHNVAVEELSDTWLNLAEKLKDIENSEDNIALLKRTETELRNKYVEQAEKISSLRKKCAAEFDKKIMAELPDLKMEKAVFVTAVDLKDENLWNERGMDSVCFTAATNPDTPRGQINKIASGGELARFMLALKVNLAQVSQVETMIFDEVDSGIGGATARAVGEKLARLGKNVQVMSVTHSPQIAALGECHFKVAKNVSQGITTTGVTRLNETEKNEEIARMLSGEQITDEARAAAKVLIGA